MILAMLKALLKSDELSLSSFGLFSLQISSANELHSTIHALWVFPHSAAGWNNIVTFLIWELSGEPDADSDGVGLEDVWWIAGLYLGNTLGTRGAPRDDESHLGHFEWWNIKGPP